MQDVFPGPPPPFMYCIYTIQVHLPAFKVLLSPSDHTGVLWLLNVHCVQFPDPYCTGVSRVSGKSILCTGVNAVQAGGFAHPFVNGGGGYPSVLEHSTPPGGKSQLRFHGICESLLSVHCLLAPLSSAVGKG